MIETRLIRNSRIIPFSFLQTLSPSRLLGRGNSITGTPEVITLGTNLSMTGTTLNASGGGVTDGDKGDITVSDTGATWTVDNDVITFAKMQNIASDSLIGRDTASTGDPENITLNATLSMTGTGELQRAALTGDVTASAGSNATTITNDVVSDAKLRNSGALFVIGRSANSTGDPADISASAASGAVLRESGSTIGFGTVASAGIADNAVTDGKLRDSAALSVIGRTANSSGDPADIATTATSDAVLRESGSAIGFGTVATGGIANDAVTYAKIQNVSAASRLLGRGSASGSGDTEEISLGSGLSMSGTTLSASGGTAVGKNLIIGGDFSTNPWQRGTSFAATSNGAFTADRWVYGFVGAMAVTISRDTDVPTVAQAGQLVTNSLKIEVTTTDTSIAAGEFGHIQQLIEGYNFIPIAQKEFIASFWVKCSITGTFCVAARNSAANRSYVGTYTIASADTWELKTVSFTASPSAGTWNYTNGTGLFFSFSLAVGSTFQTTAGSWQTGNFIGTSAQTNFYGTSGNIIRFALVQIEAGGTKTEFDNLPIQHVLKLCQRYFWKSFQQGVTPAQNVGFDGSEEVWGNGSGSFLFDPALPVIMRATPTIVTYNPAASNSSARNLTDSTDVTLQNSGSISERHIVLLSPSSTGGNANNRILVHITTDAELA